MVGLHFYGNFAGATASCGFSGISCTLAQVIPLRCPERLPGVCEENAKALVTWGTCSCIQLTCFSSPSLFSARRASHLSSLVTHLELARPPSSLSSSTRHPPTPPSASQPLAHTPLLPPPPLLLLPLVLVVVHQRPCLFPAGPSPAPLSSPSPSLSAAPSSAP